MEDMREVNAERIKRIEESWRQSEELRGHIESLDIGRLMKCSNLAGELEAKIERYETHLNEKYINDLQEESAKYQKIKSLYFKGDDYQIIDFLRDVKTIITGIEQPKPLKTMK